ncbi:MAG: AbrB/MazE/SpoVT family DNA-binding domain-containing protein [Actinomycetia bacterium]|nr:AbrB/MazE/SpoVT family DNA-binding domain-containing protein [Actinomycetes bacterium]
MIVELNKDALISIPQEIVDVLGLHEGSAFDLSVQDKKIILSPRAVYSQTYIDKLRSVIDEHRGAIECGEKGTFEDVDELFSELDARCKEQGIEVIALGDGSEPQGI